MKLLIVVVLSLLSAVAAVAVGASAEVEGRKPNIILVLLDDVSAKEYTCYGGQGVNAPNMERMARDGVMFQTAWSTPLCGPTRAMLHTGRYAWRTKYYDNGILPRTPFWSRHQVMGKVMQSAGYATAMYGKSHFSNDPHRDLGFDEYAMSHYWKGYDGPPQDAAVKGSNSMYAVQWYWHPGLIANGKGIPTVADDFSPDIQTDLICDFVKRHKDRPFFVYFPTNLPHMEFVGKNFPNGPGAKWHYTSVPERDAKGNKTGRRRPGSLKADLEYADYLIGRIWNQVQAEGLEGRTVLMVAGDNGTAGYGKGKRESEVGVRVPLVVYGPGQVKKIGSCDALVDFSDFLPTLAELAGARLPQGYALDGRSFAPLLAGKPFESRPWIYSFLGTARWLRDRNWLLDGNAKLWYCGDNRDETKGYENKTASDSPEAAAARKRFAEILATIPAPDLNDPEVGAALRRDQNKAGSLPRKDLHQGAAKKKPRSPNGG